MRTHLLIALAFLCGATVARAQQLPPPVAPISSAPADAGTAGCADGGGFAASGSGIGGDRFWVNGSGAIGWIRTLALPTPLFTTGPAGPGAGAIGTPGTQVLLGQSIEYDALYGFQGEVGMFLDDDRRCSIDAKGFYLFETSKNFSTSSNAAGVPVITRPVFNALTQSEIAFFNSFPGEAAGSGSVEARSELYGGEANARYNIGGMQGVRGNLLLGFRYLRLQESLVIRDALRPLGAGILSFQGLDVDPPNSLEDEDSFGTINTFYGGQIGGQLTCDLSWLTVSIYSKLGIGSTQQEAKIAGTSTLVTPAGREVVEGGILALATNSGKHTRTVFGLVPEWGLNVGASLTQNIRVTAGYSFLMWNKVARPGTVIDRQVNPSFVPTDPSFGTAATPASPAFRFADNDGSFWAHMFNAGLELVF